MPAAGNTAPYNMPATSNVAPHSMPATGNLGPHAMPSIGNAAPHMPVTAQGPPHNQGVAFPQHHSSMHSQGAASHPVMNAPLQQPVGVMHQSRYAAAASAPPFQSQAKQATHSLVADLQLDSEPEGNLVDSDEDMWDDAAFACIDAAVSRKHQTDTQRYPAQQPAGSMQPPSHSQPASNTQIQHARLHEGSFALPGLTLTTVVSQ